MRLIGAGALSTPKKQRKRTLLKIKNIFSQIIPNSNSAKNLNKKQPAQAPRPDISKARKVSPNLDYSKVVQNKNPQGAYSLQVQFEPNHVAGRELFDQRIHDEVTNHQYPTRSRN
ncbi:hypothetical protein TNCV_189381 [Trichonephila clavipes]|nr:hypothetical protein TNCV_189381 [Trichonephila clavipes]